MTKISSVQALEELRADICKTLHPERRAVTICRSTGCIAHGSGAVIEAFQEELAREGLLEDVEILTTGCHGFCEKGPIVVIRPEEIFYHSVTPEDVPEIVKETVKNGNVVERLLYTDPQTGEKIIKESDIPFYKHQERVIFGSNGIIDPTRIGDYIAIGGYAALAKALQMDPKNVIEEVKKSGLRGRGGAGFPTGRKWEFTRNASGEPKYIICNADEGDPGAFMDRSLLEGNPHTVLEGMLIGAYAIGASKGYIYVRNEYPLAVNHIETAITQMREYGLLGENILGTDFTFDLVVYRGAGAFVCGEETALIASIEGRAGEPRSRPPYPAQSGLWGKPTNINNVKSWANVTHIFREGSEAFRAVGTETSTGTMIFSLVGKINNTGLVEVPMGITLREMIYQIGGGIPHGKKFKAVQTGGPSGGCIPEELLDLPIDYDKLTEVGAMMGSGGMIIMDEDTCMVDVARYFVNFLKDESCGKCTPCREGLYQMHEILDAICSGNGKEEDLALLEELALAMKDGSLCMLGGTAPNPVLTTLRFFKDEYIAHITDKRCPAGVCKALIRYQINPDVCTGCGLCQKNCPQEAISGEERNPRAINTEQCIKCGICVDVCNFDAVEVV
jgi:NADH-quinone oxidoreductase subunit F